MRFVLKVKHQRRVLVLLGLTLVAALTSRIAYTGDPAKAEAQTPEMVKSMKELEEVRRLLKSIQKNSSDLEKMNQVLADAQSDAEHPAGKPGPAAKPVEGQGCMKLSGMSAIKNCLIKKITEIQSAQKELYDELD